MTEQPAREIREKAMLALSYGSGHEIEKKEAALREIYQIAAPSSSPAPQRQMCPHGYYKACGICDLSPAPSSVEQAKADVYDAAAAWNCAMTKEQDKESGEAFRAALDALIASVAAQERENANSGSESTRAFYERRLREEWVEAGGTTHGSWFYHPLLPGFSGDSRSGWKYLVSALRKLAEHAPSPRAKAVE